MIETAPAPGSVIHYGYLWADESARGQEEGKKDRPAVVLAVKQEGARIAWLVVAVTHTPPRSPSDAVLLPQDVKRQIGIDDAPTWIVTTEANAFVWRGPRLRSEVRVGL